MQPAPPTKRLFPASGKIDAVVRSDGTASILNDAYHHLLVSSWPWLLTLLVAAFVLSNAIFAIVYLAGGNGIDGARPGSFADAFFFSVQTMATIGYGKLTPGTLWANVLVTGEAWFGLIGLALVTGLVFAKFSRPTARVLFSRVAVISERDGTPSLMLRMANRRSNQIVRASVHVVLARTETTLEGETLRRLYDLPLVRHESPFFALTWTAVHPITRGSPLYGATPESLAECEAEVLVSLTGLDESFAQTVNARHSYVPEEIVWNARFADILSRTTDGRRVVDYQRFHDVVPVAPPARATLLHDRHA